MAATNFSTADPKTVRKWSTALSVETMMAMYFTKRFIGKGENNVIEEKTDLESGAGDTIQFDLSVQLRGAPIAGDKRLKGTEAPLIFYTDEIKIDQTRFAVSLGGEMSNKRVIHNLRGIAKSRLKEYWAAWADQEFFMHLSGARGINQDYKVEDTSYTGHANDFIAPDDGHLLYGGSGQSKATVQAADIMDVGLIERATVKAKMMRSLDPELANMVPVDVGSGKHYVIVMSPFQEYDLRTNAGANQWLDFQKAAAGANGEKNKIFNGNSGMINDCILHCNHHVVRFDDYGAGGNLPAARALMMGRQAGIVAYGTPNQLRMRWKEERDDYDNLMNVAGGFICGVKKSRFNNRDFGVMALDTYSKDPNEAV